MWQVIETGILINADNEPNEVAADVHQEVEGEPLELTVYVDSKRTHQIVLSAAAGKIHLTVTEFGTGKAPHAIEIGDYGDAAPIATSAPALPEVIEEPHSRDIVCGRVNSRLVFTADGMERRYSDAYVSTYAEPLTADQLQRIAAIVAENNK